MKLAIRPRYNRFWAGALGLTMIAGSGRDLHLFGEPIERLLFMLAGLLWGLWWCRDRGEGA
jgi:hypothetical protein